MSRNELTSYENVYSEIKNAILTARNHVYRATNSAMVQTYWQIGRIIVEHEQGGAERAEYGQGLIKELSRRLTVDFGKGFTETNLRYMRLFYFSFPNRHALRDDLSWTHYRLLIKVENQTARDFYAEECVKSNWSTTQLERQINSFFYERLLSSHDKDAVRQEIFTKEPSKKPEDFIRDPYVLEFLNVKQDVTVYEKELETELINELQKFLLE